MTQVNLSHLTCGDILGNPRDAVYLAILIQNGKRSRPDPADRPIRLDQPVFDIVFTGNLFDLSCPDSLRIVRVDRIEPGTGLLIEALTRSSPNRLIGRADIKGVGVVWIFQPEDLIDMLGQLAEALLALSNL